MDKLLKEAIADAKAVRETALANAKLALEEAFTPKLQSMLSKKIREEEEMEEEEEVEEMPETARFRKLANISEEDDEMDMEDEETADDMDMEDDTEEDFEEEDYSDEGGDMDFEEESSEEETEEAPAKEAPAEEAPAEEEDLDLEAIIRELEGEDEEMAEEGMDYESEEEEMAEEGMDSDEDEDIDINELVKALREEDSEEEEMAEEGMKRRKKKMMEADDEEESEKDKELEEAYGVIKFLRSKINEVNLLNAKLLYVNKVFRAKNLSESQKVQVIETFDRAKNVRETKLIYATIAESISKQDPAKNKGKRLVENFSSAPVKGTKRPILESNNQVARFQKLAGINKNF